MGTFLGDFHCIGQICCDDETHSWFTKNCTTSTTPHICYSKTLKDNIICQSMFRLGICIEMWLKHSLLLPKYEAATEDVLRKHAFKTCNMFILCSKYTLNWAKHSYILVSLDIFILSWKRGGSIHNIPLSFRMFFVHHVKYIWPMQ